MTEGLPPAEFRSYLLVPMDKPSVHNPIPDSTPAPERQVWILSTAECEVSTEEVADWLEASGVRAIRVNGEDLDDEGRLKIFLGNSCLSATLRFGDGDLNVRDCAVVWFRRWGHRMSFRDANILNDPGPAREANERTVAMHLLEELRSVSHFFFSLLDNAVWLSHPASTCPNKMKTLVTARSVGLDIPATIVTNNREAMVDLARQCPDLITKPMSNPTAFQPTGGRGLFSYTAPIDSSTLDALRAISFPCLLQERLDKQFDIRTFFLDGTCYSMAIFSQAHAPSRVDGRRQDPDLQPRTVPYRLPRTTEDHVRLLMSSLGLETGSLDFVKTVNGRTVFLEVNPIGQFGMVSKPCNYQLEKLVAAALLKRLTSCHPHQ